MVHSPLQLADRHRQYVDSGVGHIRQHPVGRVGRVVALPLQHRVSHRCMRVSMAACPAEMAPTSGVGTDVPPAGCTNEAMPALNTTLAAQQMPHSMLRAPGQTPVALSALKQCVLLGAAALLAAPLLLLLDVAEHASLGVTQLKQSRQHAASAARRKTDQRQGFSPTQSAHSQPASAGSNTNNSTIKGINRQQPADLWLPDAYPPIAFMTLTLLPLLLLAARHSLIGSSGILQPVFWCFVSLMIQAYLSLLLAVWQRVQPRAATAAGVKQAAAGAASETEAFRLDTPGSAGVATLVATPHWWQPALAASAIAAPDHWNLQAANNSSPAAGASTAEAVHNQRQQDVSDGSSAGLAGYIAVRIPCRLFKVVQVCADAFRCGCIYNVAVMLYQQQAPLAFTWANPVISILHSNGAGGLSALVTAASASAMSLQHNVGSLLWLICDVGLCGGALAVYVLSLTARLLPFVDGMVQC